MINFFRKLIGRKPIYRVPARGKYWSVKRNGLSFGYCNMCNKDLRGDEECVHSMAFISKPPRYTGRDPKGENIISFGD